MNSISAVEYFSNRMLVRVTLWFKIEASTMNENSNWFILAYSFPLLQLHIIEKLEISRELLVAHDLFHSGNPLG